MVRVRVRATEPRTLFHILSYVHLVYRCTVQQNTARIYLVATFTAQVLPVLVACVFPAGGVHAPFARSRLREDAFCC